MMTRLTALLALGLLSGGAAAQTSADRAPEHTPFDDYLFPPELVMQHQRELALSAQQRTAITEAVKGLQAQVVDFQWQIHEEQQKLGELLAQGSVPEATALAQIDRVLDLERQVKKAHLSALIRIKNTLTPEQQKQLLPLKRHRVTR